VLELSAPGSPLCALRARLERVRTTAPLFDTARFCRQLEAAYAHIRERPARGPNPASLTPSDR
jgi:predicted O-linked N-acetylglucosamine transferase (SPINDLY family)